MGMGENNKGEMGAIFHALQALEQAIASGRVAKGSLFILFSDSAICIAYLERGWAFSTWVTLARATRALLRKVRKLVTVALYWIRGHKGIPGNEAADVAAEVAVLMGSGLAYESTKQKAKLAARSLTRQVGVGEAHWQDDEDELAEGSYTGNQAAGGAPVPTTDRPTTPMTAIASIPPPPRVASAPQRLPDRATAPGSPSAGPGTRPRTKDRGWHREAAVTTSADGWSDDEAAMADGDFEGRQLAPTVGRRTALQAAVAYEDGGHYGEHARGAFCSVGAARDRGRPVATGEEPDHDGAWVPHTSTPTAPSSRTGGGPPSRNEHRLSLLVPPALRRRASPGASLRKEKQATAPDFKHMACISADHRPP